MTPAESHPSVQPSAQPQVRHRRTKQVEDVETLRALAHPLRIRLLSALRVDGPATASALGRRLGESSGSTSYHLRQLARYGFVAEDENQPSRRERRWRALHERTTWHSRGFADDPAGREADRWMIAMQAQVAARVAGHWLAERDSWPAAWQSAAEISDYGPRLTPAALSQLMRDITALVDRYEDEYASSPDTERVHLYVQAVPGVDASLLAGPG